MNRILSWFCKIFLKLPVDLFLIKEVRGKDNIPKRNFILAANHQSHLDQIVTGYVCVPRRFIYIGQTDRYAGFDRLLLNVLYFIAGVIRVNRKISESRKKAKEEAIEHLKKGDCLVIYPEGTRTRTGEIKEGKCGTAKIFLKTGVQILPVGIKGTFELMPPGKSLPKIKREVKINIGKPLFFEKEKKALETGEIQEGTEAYQEILKKITDKVMEEITSLAGQDRSSLT
ncbi:1-acyl-sn-glycerol-3-phosphate acyltransferase [Patescibacteria group bacterium]|nr:1-acyl-sn-glycerol-3-phosphate acyltransferase [Patescibacteria group bacterium]